MVRSPEEESGASLRRGRIKGGKKRAIREWV